MAWKSYSETMQALNEPKKAWTSPANTLIDLRKPKAPPLPPAEYLISVRDRAIKALDQATYEVYKSLWCPCGCIGKYHHVHVEPDVSFSKIKKQLREKSVFWCKPCLAFCKANLKKKSGNKRFCSKCGNFVFQGDLCPQFSIMFTNNK